MKELELLKHGSDAVLSALEGLTASDLELRPSPKSRSLSELLVHMYAAQVELGQALRPELPVPAAPQRLAEFRTYIQNCHDIVRSALQKEDALEEVAIPGGFGKRTASVTEIKELILTEQFHHRGQLSIYFELLGKPFANIYAYRSEQ